MERKKLGRTGLEVSRLGLGLSETGFNLPQDQIAQATRVLNDALDGGVNFLVSAECYGLSEEQIGVAVSHRRNEYVLATKCGHFMPRGQGPDWTRELILEQIDRSLKKMKTDHVDLLQLHSCSVEVLEKGEVTRALQDIRKAGKTRFIGYSGDNANAEWAVNSGLFDTLQTSFNLVDQKARKTLFPDAEKRGMGVIVKRPIANAAWGAAADPRPYQHLPSYTEEYFRRAQSMQAEGPIPGDPGDRILLAIGFTFAHPEVDVAIVGTQRPEHLRSNIEMVSKRPPLSTDAVKALHDRYDRVSGNWEQRG
ncbi:MAG: aldo/keto reductase [Chloroflexi bacterium]|nr:aldo/keto reductase [Chloroflexota bacterium]